MRKLILAGIITVLTVVVWISYLRYDVQQFKKELSSTPDASSLSEQQTQDTAKEGSAAAPGSIIESTMGDEKASQLPTAGGPAETSEDVEHPDRVRSNTEKVEDVMESGGTPADTELSPEVVALYTDLQPFYDEYAKAGWEYMQVMTKMHESVDRKKEIIQEQTSNPETAQELRQLQTWINENYSSYQDLQVEMSSRADAMETFLKSRGYSSRDGKFDWQAFFKWRGESSK